MIDQYETNNVLKLLALTNFILKSCDVYNNSFNKNLFLDLLYK